MYCYIPPKSNAEEELSDSETGIYVKILIAITQLLLTRNQEGSLPFSWVNVPTL